jgi:hypothetical protein
LLVLLILASGSNEGQYFCPRLSLSPNVMNDNVAIVATTKHISPINIFNIKGRNKAVMAGLNVNIFSQDDRLP